ncbi:MAG: hypothetical protein QOJ26_1817 [Thermoplasmata archaeon]|jgi:hypothetical protein|nr:hypothetical protein [Thermoplasmata archaeon]
MADDGEPRADAELGIDRSEQSGLGGDSSVLEEYGEDTDPTDNLPERVEAPEPVLPGTDPDVPKDLAAEGGAPDPNLPLPGHELKPGLSKAGDAPLKRPQDLQAAIEAAEQAEQQEKVQPGASGNTE